LGILQLLQALRVILSASCQGWQVAGSCSVAVVIFGVVSGPIKASKRNARCETAMESQLNERGHMRRTVIILSCAMVAPLAFAQTQTTKTRQTTTTQPAVTRATTQMTTGAVTVGTVTAFTPGQITTTAPSPIVVQSSPDAKPISYVLGRKVRYVDKDGRAIDPHLIRPGTRVHLDFDRRGTVKRVLVVERE